MNLRFPNKGEQYVMADREGQGFRYFFAIEAAGGKRDFT